jgi:bacterioferritin-associated ferredoxin
MIICHCYPATDRDIRAAAAKGASCGEIAQSCQAGTSCGGCVPAIVALLKQMKDDPHDTSQRRSER